VFVSFAKHVDYSNARHFFRNDAANSLGSAAPSCHGINDISSVVNNLIVTGGLDGLLGNVFFTTLAL
jgi:hypothetical protein